MDAESLKLEGNALLHDKKPLEALGKYLQGLTVDPLHRTLLSNASAVLLELGRYAEAEEMARRCTAAAPDWAKGHFRQGLALEALHRKDEALVAYETARALEPESQALGAACARLSTAPPVGLAWIKGAKVFTQHAYWIDCEPSLAAVSAFKVAHATAAASAGLSNEQVAAEQQLFDVPFIFGAMGPGGVDAVELPPRASLLCSGVRFIVTVQPPKIVQQVAACAARLRAVAAADLEQEANVSHALAGLPLEVPALLLCALLNAPERANVYVFSLDSGDCGATLAPQVTVVSASLRLDVRKLDAACRRVVATPTPAQQCMSRWVCVWCGAAPVAEGIALQTCPGCTCVAYCSAECQDLDRIAEHGQECSRREDGKTADGYVVRARTRISVTRAITETTKPESAKLLLPGTEATGLEISRIACLTGLPEGSPQVLLVPMSWDVQSLSARAVS